MRSSKINNLIQHPHVQAFDTTRLIHTLYDANTRHGCFTICSFHFPWYSRQKSVAKVFFRVAVKMMCWTTQIHNKLIRRTNFLSFKLPNFNSLSSPSIEHQKHNFHLHNRTMFVMCAMLYVSDGGRKKIAKMFARVRGRGGDYSRTIENISLFVSSSAPTIFFPLLRCVEMGKNCVNIASLSKKKLWFSAPTHKLARCSPVVVCRW